MSLGCTMIHHNTLPIYLGIRATEGNEGEKSEINNLIERDRVNFHDVIYTYAAASSENSWPLRKTRLFQKRMCPLTKREKKGGIFLLYAVYEQLREPSAASVPTLSPFRPVLLPLCNRVLLLYYCPLLHLLQENIVTHSPFFLTSCSY